MLDKDKKGKSMKKKKEIEWNCCKSDIEKMMCRWFHFNATYSDKQYESNINDIVLSNHFEFSQVIKKQEDGTYLCYSGEEWICMKFREQIYTFLSYEKTIGNFFEINLIRKSGERREITRELVESRNFLIIDFQLGFRYDSFYKKECFSGVEFLLNDGEKNFVINFNPRQYKIVRRKDNGFLKCNFIHNYTQGNDPFNSCNYKIDKLSSYFLHYEINKDSYEPITIPKNYHIVKPYDKLEDVPECSRRTYLGYDEHCI